MTSSATAPDLPHRTVIRPWPVDRPAVRVFLFHHAGGTHHFFRDWAGLFPADWEVLLMEAPGRGSRAGHRCQDIGELAELLRREVHPLLDRPYGFFGHSMGALVCTELARRLRARGPGPRWLGLSAWSADRAAPDGRRTNRSLLPDPQLRSLVVAMGGTPPEILENDAMWRRFSPAIRDDFRLLDTTDPSLFAPVAGVPHSLFGGDDDATLPPEQLIALARSLAGAAPSPPRRPLLPAGAPPLRGPADHRGPRQGAAGRRPVTEGVLPPHAVGADTRCSPPGKACGSPGRPGPPGHPGNSSRISRRARTAASSTPASLDSPPSAASARIR